MCDALSVDAQLQRRAVLFEVSRPRMHVSKCSGVIASSTFVILSSRGRLGLHGAVSSELVVFYISLLPSQVKLGHRCCATRCLVTESKLAMGHPNARVHILHSVALAISASSTGSETRVTQRGFWRKGSRRSKRESRGGVECTGVYL
jgi:hypothetical protein